ncbi:MAG: hypothetical protein ABW136_10635 [Steroidobacteraceae bacterium]
MAVPWTQLIRWAPQIIVLSRELLQRSRREPEPSPVANPTQTRADLELRIAVLEDNERRQAELVEQMAEQQAELTRAIVALHRRERILIPVIVIALGLAIWALFR